MRSLRCPASKVTLHFIILAAVFFSLGSRLAKAAQAHGGWSLNFTPVYIASDNSYRAGGGADPEVKYSLKFGNTYFSAGARMGGYYAKNLFGVTAMPTVRLTFPIGKVDPYISAGMGYGRLPKIQHNDLSSMSRLGFFVHMSDKWGIGLEATHQRIYNSNFKFISYGSMIAFDL